VTVRTRTRRHCVRNWQVTHLGVRPVATVSPAVIAALSRRPRSLIRVPEPNALARRGGPSLSARRLRGRHSAAVLPVMATRLGVRAG
jgi:hypothetical protein